MSEALKRIKEFIDEEGLSVRQFEIKTGFSNGSFASQLKNDKTIGIDKLENILNKFPDLSPDWVLTGEGEMLKSADKAQALMERKGKYIPAYKNIEPGTQEETEGVPYYNIDFSNTNISDLSTVNEQEVEYYVNYLPFNDCTAYLPMFGDSMLPKYSSGDILAVKQMHNMGVILWGEAYFIITNEETNNIRTIKLLFEHEDEKKIILRAENPSFKGDIILDRNAILSLYIIKGKITRNQL